MRPQGLCSVLAANAQWAIAAPLGISIWPYFPEDAAAGKHQRSMGTSGATPIKCCLFRTPDDAVMALMATAIGGHWTALEPVVRAGSRYKGAPRYDGAVVSSNGKYGAAHQRKSLKSLFERVG